MKTTVKFFAITGCFVLCFILFNRLNPEQHSIGADLRKRHLDETLDLSRSRRLAQDLLSLIYYRYELNTVVGSTFFLTSNNIGEHTWDVLKYKYATKILKGNSTFLMTFGGSSVTAGHDNYYNQSYPLIVKQRMSKLLESLGIELIVHNIAQGANNCIPYTFCYESMGGLDPDFVGWEQSYNCGHDDAVFELTARVAGWSQNQGVVYYSASGAWSPSDCPPAKSDPPYCSEEWTPELAGLKTWRATAADLSAIKKKYHLFNQAKASSQRFSGSWSRNDYQGPAPHGFNVWESNPLCRAMKDGKEITNCNGIDSVQKCGLKFLSKEAADYGSDNKRGANWHPTRAFHMLRGEAITWLYTLTLLDAIYMVEKDLQSKSKSSLISDYQNTLNKLHPSLPQPKKCMQYHCDQRPTCYTNFGPHYQAGQKLKDIVVGNTNWTVEDEGLGEWSLHYGYLDVKPMYYSDGPTHGEIHFQIQIDRNDFILICGSVKESLLHTLIYLDLNVEGDLTNYTPSETRVLWTKRKYLAGECKYLLEIPRGRHVVSIHPHEEHKNHKTGLSHVITWP